MDLVDLGYNNFFAENFEQYKDKEYFPARVARENKELYFVLSEFGEHQARISGRFRHQAGSQADFPSVGDWVVLEKNRQDKFGVIHAILPRKSSFTRKAVLGPGRIEQQVMASNTEFVFIVTTLDSDFSLRRLERYLAISWDSGAMPIIILNKADLCENIEEKTHEISQVAYGIKYHIVSALENNGLECFGEYLKPGISGVFLGSSGVGKSTIINALSGSDNLLTGDVRDYDKKGRHTTTWRELIILPDGGIVIDTPGLREIQAFDDDSGIEKTFDEIEGLAVHCKFSDCTHTSEPGCAINEAIESGQIDEKRLKNYRKLKREAEYMKRKVDQKANLVEQNKWKQITKSMRQYKKFQGKK